jgi:hypothetical protein
MSLLLHCGSQPIDRQQLAAIPTPPPLGPRHHPYPYGEYVDRVEDGLQTVGLRVVDEQYGALKDGARFFGLMEVEPVFKTERDYALIVGLRGSHDQTFPRGLVAGSRVFVCDNLAFSGEIKVTTRQTTNIERRLPGLILNAVRDLEGIFQVQDARFQTYRNFELKPRWGDAAITELVRRQVINASQVGRVISEWDEPSHEEHAEDGHTLWRMHNAVTEALKMPTDDNGMPTRAAAPMAMTRTVGLTGFLDEIAGFNPVH